jgi:hypothetical protein
MDNSNESRIYTTADFKPFKRPPRSYIAMNLPRTTLNNNDQFANEEQRQGKYFAFLRDEEAGKIHKQQENARKAAQNAQKAERGKQAKKDTRRVAETDRTKKHLEDDDSDEDEIDEDSGLMSTEELELLETYHNLNGREVTDDKIKIILKRLTEAMSDLQLNVYTCCVCDLFKKRKYFEHIDFRSVKQKHLIKHMNERLHHHALKPKLPPDLLAEFNPIWTSRPELDGLLLSIDGFQNKQPSVKPGDKDIAYMCTACHFNLKRPSKTNNPPKYALANHLVIGTCPLKELTQMQNKMLALITTRSEVVVYR